MIFFPCLLLMLLPFVRSFLLARRNSAGTHNTNGNVFNDFLLLLFISLSLCLFTKKGIASGRYVLIFTTQSSENERKRKHKNAELATASLMCNENGSFCHHRSSLSNARVNINTLQYIGTWNRPIILFHCFRVTRSEFFIQSSRARFGVVAVVSNGQVNMRVSLCRAYIKHQTPIRKRKRLDAKSKYSQKKRGTKRVQPQLQQQQQEKKQLRVGALSKQRVIITGK